MLLSGSYSLQDLRNTFQGFFRYWQGNDSPGGGLSYNLRVFRLEFRLITDRIGNRGLRIYRVQSDGSLELLFNTIEYDGSGGGGGSGKSTYFVRCTGVQYFFPSNNLMEIVFSTPSDGISFDGCRVLINGTMGVASNTVADFTISVATQPGSSSSRNGHAIIHTYSEPQRWGSAGARWISGTQILVNVWWNGEKPQPGYNYGTAGYSPSSLAIYIEAQS
jgi:hypothetical protein